MMLTLFTPAYNRAATLPRLYESLLRQSCYDFEWLIVDDGSQDDTARVVGGFSGDGKFPIRYVKKENGGKHTAHNRALKEATGDWFMCVDSDDTLAPDAVRLILNAAQKEEGISGIISYKTDLEGKLLSSCFPENVCRSNLYELDARYGVRGEFALAFPTEFARKFPFPEFPGERFMGESVVYDRMEQAGEMFLLNEVTMPCEYQADGYTQQISTLMKNNPSGFCLYYMQRIDMVPTLKEKWIRAGQYHCFKWMSGNKSLKYKGSHPLLVTVSSVLGWAFLLYYKLVRGF